MDHLESFAAAQGITTLHLTSTPAALDFSQRHGWRAGKAVVLNVLGVDFEETFIYAIFEHLASVDTAITEVFRVLRPGGIAAIRSPDWGGFLVGPETPGLEDAIRGYAELQTANGGDIHIGRKLPRLLRNAGFTKIKFSAEYDCYRSVALIAEYLSLKLNASRADAMRKWSTDPDAYFAQAWCSVIGQKTG